MDTRKTSGAYNDAFDAFALLTFFEIFIIPLAVVFALCVFVLHFTKRVYHRIDGFRHVPRLAFRGKNVKRVRQSIFYVVDPSLQPSSCYFMPFFPEILLDECESLALEVFGQSQERKISVLKIFVFQFAGSIQFVDRVGVSVLYII